MCFYQNAGRKKLVWIQPEIFLSTYYSTACIMKEVRNTFWGNDIENNKQVTGSFQLKHITLRFNNYVSIKMQGGKRESRDSTTADFFSLPIHYSTAQIIKDVKITFWTLTLKIINKCLTVFN